VGVLRAAADFDPVTALAAYTGPRFIVDTWLGEQPFSLRKLCPEVRCVRIGDSGHWLQLDRPQQFNLILDGWLGAHNPVRRDLPVAAAD
jgi:pimeloyl-ACP methyl ester carboxylesterase